jgi:hypothetical protein
MTYEQFGWKNYETKFLLGNTLYSAEGEEVVGGNKDLHERMQWVGPVEGGSLAGWREAASRLFAKDCEAQGATILAAFAAPLMRFADNQDGGCIWSLVTPDSGRGKTMAATAAISVFGLPRGLELKTEFSKAARGLTMAAIGNLPCMNDELRARDPVLMREFVLWYTGGRDKNRATKDGSIKHSENSWQNILITTDNYSLVDAVTTDAIVEDAAQMRVIELPCDIPKGRNHIYGDELRKQLLVNAGWAGQAFVRYLVNPIDENGKLGVEWAHEQIQHFMRLIYKSTGWDARYRFWVRTLACVTVAGMIAADEGLIEFNVRRIVEWLLDQLKRRARPQSSQWHVATLSTFLDQHGDVRLNVDCAWTKGQNCHILAEPKHGKVTIRYEADSGRYYILQPALREWVTKQGKSYRHLMDVLVEQKVVTNRQKRVTLGAGTRYSTGQVWAVEVDGKSPIMTGVPRLVPDPIALEDESHPLPGTAA